MHRNEGTLRAYLDGELDAQACTAVAAHLRECAACRKQLELLASRASATSQRLQALAPRGVELPAPAPVALTRLHARLADEREETNGAVHVAPHRPQDRQASAGGWVEMFRRMFNTRYRAAWAGFVAMLVIASLFTLAPVLVLAVALDVATTSVGTLLARAERAFEAHYRAIARGFVPVT